MSNQPNIVIFNPDQWRGDVMGHLGDPAAVTPNLDRLAAEEAVSFRWAFCQNTVCTPSRCSFMTGWYPHVRGHRTMFHMLHPEEKDPNLLTILRENGYFVWWGGKNDLVPGQDGSERYCDVKFNPTDEDFRRWGRVPRATWGGDFSWRGEPDGDRYYGFLAGVLDTEGDDLVCDHDWANILGALDFIRDYDGEKPFCLYLPLVYPHPPYAVEKEWFDMIDSAAIPPRTPAPEDWSDKPSILKAIWEGQKLQAWPEERWKELRAVYYGMCARLDHQLGLLIDAMKEKGLWDDTALFFFADHGDYTGDLGLVEKTQNTFEDYLARVPFLIKPPAGVPVKPRVCDGLVELVDFSATVYALTGIEPSYTLFGKSLLPVLSGETEEVRDAAFCEGGRLLGEVEAMEHTTLERYDDPTESQYWPRIRVQTTDEHPWHTKATMCRTHDYKYIRRFYEKDELYDLRKDPRETTNLIDDPAYRDILLQLQDRMLTWYMETCDVVPHQLDSRFLRPK